MRLEEQSLRVRAYETLKKRILSGEMEPGKLYSETRVSGEMEISRTPLRDAIQHLASEGYLDVVPSKGFRIHELTKRDLLETCQIRCALEGFCVVQLAREPGSQAARAALEELEGMLARQQQVVERGQNIREFTGCDEAFHRAIVCSLGNSMFTETFESYRWQMRRQTEVSLEAEGRMAETVAEHRAIVEAIRAGDTLRSYEATLTHLEKARGIIPLP